MRRITSLSIAALIATAIVTGCNSAAESTSVPDTEVTPESDATFNPSTEPDTTMGKAPNFTYDSDTPFKMLLDKASDFDLADATFIKIGDRYGHMIEAKKYTPEERTIMLVWHSSGIIENGGFEYLFSGGFDTDPDFALTAGAYKAIGLPRGYEAFMDAFRIFPGGKVPRDPEKRIAQYKTASEEVRDKINTKHWKDGWEDLREKKVAEYIRHNVSKLGDLK